MLPARTQGSITLTARQTYDVFTTAIDWAKVACPFSARSDR
jgi:hypothetical protein